MEWTVEDVRTTADNFHRRMPADDTGPAIWIAELSSRALVLGSTQPDELINTQEAKAAGYEVCRRRSGGGIVHIDPSTDCWIDVVVPSSSALWSDDVGKAFHWLGRHWVDTLTRLTGSTAGSPTMATSTAGSPTMATSTAGSPTMATSTAGSPRAGALWCFAGLGHGEVTIDGYKVLGLSQRRTRTWARLQGLVLGRWPRGELERYLSDDAIRSGSFGPEVITDPALIKAGPPPDLVLPSPADLAAAFLERLPQP